MDEPESIPLYSDATISIDDDTTVIVMKGPRLP